MRLRRVVLALTPTNDLDLQTLVDPTGRVMAVVVPMEAWREIASETHHLLRSPAMRERLVVALGRSGGASFGEAMSRLGLSDNDLVGE